MKVTYGEILEAKTALEILAKKELKTAEAIGLARLIKALNSELEVFFQKQRELCEKYGEFDEKSGSFKPFEESREPFFEKHAELLGTAFDADITRAEIHSDIAVEAATVLGTEKFVEWGEKVDG